VRERERGGGEGGREREVCNIKINRLGMEDGTELRHMSNKGLQF